MTPTPCKAKLPSLGAFFIDFPRAIPYNILMIKCSQRRTSTR